MQMFKSKKGLGTEFFTIAGIALFAIMAVIVVMGVIGSAMGWNLMSATGNLIGGGDDDEESSGVPVESLAVMQINKYTEATEGGDDVEFWDLGKDVTISTYTARETIDLTSGAATDTSVPSLRSHYTEEDMDLYIEGAGNYYDDMISDWKIEYNAETGKGVLTNNAHDTGAVVATDIGTFKDIDTVASLDTGFGQQAAGTVNYSISAGADGGYIEFYIGNTEAESELRSVVFCVKDADQDLEGNEITSLTLSHVSGDNFNINSNVLGLFTDVAGKGGAACTSVGTIEDIKSGKYKLQIGLTEANFEADEEFEIMIDDLGNAWEKDYPSRNAKATPEDLVITRVA